MTWFCGVVCAVGAQRWLGVVGAGRWPADGLSSPGEARTNIRRRSSLAAPDWSTSSARRVCARRLQSERSATCVATAARRGAPMPCAVGATRPVLQAAAVCLCSGMSPCRRAGPARLSARKGEGVVELVANDTHLTKCNRKRGTRHLPGGRGAQTQK